MESEYMLVRESEQLRQCSLHRAVKGNDISTLSQILLKAAPISEEPSLAAFNQSFAERLIDLFHFNQDDHSTINPEKQSMLEDNNTGEVGRSLWVYLEKVEALLNASTLLGRTDVIKYLMKLRFPEKLLFSQDVHGFTLLLRAKNKHVAALLIDYIESTEKQQELLSIRNSNGQSVAHYIEEVKHGNTELAEYLINKSGDYLLTEKDIFHGTVLHGAKNEQLAQSIIARIPVEERFAYILQKDMSGYTVLHTSALFGRLYVVQYLCSFSALKEELLQSCSEDGRTALHCAVNAQIAEVLVESVKDSVGYLLAEDHSGNSVAMTAAKEGNCQTMEYCLEYLEAAYLGEPDVMKRILADRNAFDQTIFHLAAISPYINALYDILAEYITYVDIDQLILPDRYNNTLLNYIAARFSTQLFATLIMKIPLSVRKLLVSQVNKRGTNCRTIVHRPKFYERFFLQNILCERMGKSKHQYITRFQTFGKRYGSKTPELIFPLDFVQANEDMRRVLKYALNEYSLTESYYFRSYRLAAMVLTSTQPRLLLYQGEASVGESEFDTVSAASQVKPMLWLHVTSDQLKIPENRINLQKTANSMDIAEYHGKPKVIVIEEMQHENGNQTYVIPPGPDFMIVTATFAQWHGYRESQKQVLTSIDNLVDDLRDSGGVVHVRVDSTLGKRCSSAKARPRSAAHTVTEKKALIICNCRNRDGWEKELRNAKKLLEYQLQFQVLVKYDLTANEMLQVTGEFAESSDHGEVLALALMAHGDMNGNICGNDKESVCSVQDLVNKLDHHMLKGIPKILFLSFCRGKLGQPRSNRTRQAWECTVLPTLYESTSFNLIRRELDVGEKEREWSIHPLRPLTLQVDTYICFSTLPDSKAQRGLMFETYCSYLDDLTKTASMLHRDESLSSFMSDINIGCDDSSDVDEDVPPCVTVALPSGHVTNTSKSHIGSSTATSTSELSPQKCRTKREIGSAYQSVELITLFTDVSGIARERSEFTQYMNYCYMVNKDSKPVVLQVYPVRNRDS